MVEQAYPLGTTIFWGAVVPASIFILLLLGHELWWRICPLSFLSQIPRALAWAETIRAKESKNWQGALRISKSQRRFLVWQELSLRAVWLVVYRIMWANPVFSMLIAMLTAWLLFTILAAISVGYLYSGKSWCQYFCPMALVQRIYSKPGGLLSSKAHMSDQSITQSMFRTVLPDGKEQSACVACQNPFIDIDSERTYWDSLNKPETAFLRYGYVGLVVGYFGITICMRVTGIIIFQGLGYVKLISWQLFSSLEFFCLGSPSISLNLQRCLWCWEDVRRLAIGLDGGLKIE